MHWRIECWTTDGWKVVVEEWWTLGIDDGVSVANIVSSILEVEVGCKEGSIVSDEELCNGSLNDKYEDFWVGCINI